MAQGPLLPKRRSPIDAGGAAAGLPAKQPHLRMTVCATAPPRSSGHLIWPLRDCPQICEGLETEDTQPCREASASPETASWKLQQRGPKQAVSSWLSEKCVFSLTRPIFSPALCGCPLCRDGQGLPEPRADGGSPWTAGRPRV